MINKKTIAGIALAGTLAMTGTGAAYAMPGTEQQNTQNTEIKQKKQEIHKQFKNALDNLVKDGTITRAQEDAILKAMAAKREKFEKEKLEKGKLENGKLQNGKPDNGTQKPSQGKDIKFRPQGHPQGHHDFLQDLVKDGTLTQVQADAVRKAFRSARESVK